MAESEPFRVRSSGCGVKVRHLRETDSTNRDARSWAAEGAEHGAVVVTDHQLAGRGRFERTWESAPGQNLLLTVIVRRELPRPALLPLAAGVAVRECVSRFISAGKVTLKWPNDVRVDRKKVAGILVESPENGTYLVGVGLNVNQVEFPEGMASEPTSLMLESGQRVDRGEVFGRLMASLDDSLDKLEGGTLLDTYEEHLEGIGSTVMLQDGREGVMEDVDSSGGLVIRTPTATIVVHSGDVSLRSPDSA